MSKIREHVPQRSGELVSEPEGDLRTYEVFTQLERGKPHVYAGSLDAADGEMALRFAREHYGRDQPCVQIWVVPRDAILATEHDDVVWRLSDQSYRQAKGYDVGAKWTQFRKKRDYDEYRREDLKEGF